MGDRTRRIVAMLAGLACFAQVWQVLRAPREARSGVRVTVDLVTSVTDDVELFYDTVGQGFGEAWSVRRTATASLHPQRVVFDLPAVTVLHGLRFDPGDHPMDFALRGISISGPYRSVIWDHDDIADLFSVQQHVDSTWHAVDEHAFAFTCEGSDPFLATGRDLEPLLRKTLSRDRPALFPLLIAAFAGLMVAWLTWLVCAWRIPLHFRLFHGWRIAGSLIVLAASGLIFFLTHALLDGIAFTDHKASILVTGGFTADDRAQVYHAPSKGRFTQERIISKDIQGNTGAQMLRFELPRGADSLFLRFDPGMSLDTLWLDSITLQVDDRMHTWKATDLPSLLRPNAEVTGMSMQDERLTMRINGNDPFFLLDADLAPAIRELGTRSGNGPLPTGIALLFTLYFFFGTGPRIARHELERKGAGTGDVILLVASGMIMTAPLVTAISGTEPELKNTEKRRLAEKPPFTLERMLSYPAEFTSYYEENFGLRKLFFRWNSLFVSNVLRTSPLPDKVIFGRDDWMFYIQPGIWKKYEGVCDLSGEELRSIADRLEKRRVWLAEHGIEYVMMFPPEKSVIYADKLPWRIKRFNEPSCLDNLKRIMAERTGLTIVDVRKELLSARSIDEVYYTSDTHWNPIGAWFGYAALIQALRAKDSTIAPPRPFHRYRIEHDVNPMGDLAELMGMADVYTRTTPHMIPLDARLARDTTISPSVARYTRYMPIVKHVPNSKAPRLLMFRDSFTVYMVPNLSEHFSRSSFVWTPIFFHEVVQEERPDIIVHEVMELFISDLLKDDREVPEELFTLP